MKKILTPIAMLAGSVTAAFAGDPCNPAFGQPPASCTTAVPEISAMEGTAALVALAAIVLLTWERRRRAS